MFSLEGIRAGSLLAARKAAQESRRPYIVEADDLADFQLTIRAGVVPRFPFPFVGPAQPRSPSGSTPRKPARTI
jgi:hypothetical protein